MRRTRAAGGGAGQMREGPRVWKVAWAARLARHFGSTRRLMVGTQGTLAARHHFDLVGLPACSPRSARWRG